MATAPTPLVRAANSALGPDDLTGSNALVIGVFALVAVIMAWAIVRERRTKRLLGEHAAAHGWWPVTSDEPIPSAVAEAARDGRTELAFAAEREYPMWLVWQHWTESSGHRASTSSSTSTSTTHDLTRYYLLLGPGYPDIEVVRRTAIGGFIMPVRGLGTGDAAFDKKFLVRGPGEHQAAVLLTPTLREAMLAGIVPAWKISGRLLISSYDDALTLENFEPRAELLADLARTLTGSGR